MASRETTRRILAEVHAPGFAEDDRDSSVQAMDFMDFRHLAGTVCRDIAVEPAGATISGTLDWRDVTRP